MKYKKAFLKKIRKEITFKHKEQIAEEKSLTIRTVYYILNGKIEDRHDVIKRSIELIKQHKTFTQSIIDSLN